MKILFITYFFAPYNCIGAVRTTRTVEKLIDMGHDVKIISAKDQHLMSNLSTTVSETHIKRTSWFDFEKPIYSILGSNKVSSVKNNTHKGSFTSKLLNLINIIFQRVISMPDKYIGWYSFAVKESKKIINKGWVPDLIFASATPYTSLIVAKKISKYYDIPWIGELRDLWSDNHYGYGWWIDKKFEKSTLKTASALVTVSKTLKIVLEKKYPYIPVHTVQNAFDEKDFLSAHQKKETSEVIKIVYTGAVYSGKRDPSPLFEALEQNEDIRKSIHVDFYGNDLGYIDFLVKKYNLFDCVHINGSVSREAALKYQQEASVLLLLTWDNPKEKGVLTGKLFEYIGSSKPILLIGALKDEASKLITDNGLGVASNSPSEIIQFLKNLSKEDFNININSRKRFERTQQVINLQNIFYEVTKP